MTLLSVTGFDLAQAVFCGLVLWSAVCRLNLLQWGVSRLEPIVAQLALVFGATVLGLGFLFDAHATWTSVTFAGCTAVCAAVGVTRWRERAPHDTHRQPTSYGGSA